MSTLALIALGIGHSWDSFGTIKTMIMIEPADFHFNLGFDCIWRWHSFIDVIQPHVLPSASRHHVQSLPPKWFLRMKMPMWQPSQPKKHQSTRWYFHSQPCSFCLRKGGTNRSGNNLISYFNWKKKNNNNAVDRWKPRNALKSCNCSGRLGALSLGSFLSSLPFVQCGRRPIIISVADVTWWWCDLIRFSEKNTCSRGLQ